MNVKKIKQALKLVEKLEKLDKEIIEIDKIALSLVNEELKVNLSLSIENKNKTIIWKDENLEDENSFTDYNYIITYNWAMDFGKRIESIKENSNKTLFSVDINYKIAMQALGIIVCEKNKEREILIKQIEAIEIK